jgi:hypothetical protein
VLPVIAAVILSPHVSIGPIATEQTRDRSPESLIILTDTGERRDDLKVVARHPSPERHLSELTRGFSGRLLRLYPLVQRFARPDRQPQPAYLLLSNDRGGFPRFGFHLDGRAMPDVAYVDLHRGGSLSNRFGAMNQIYPHELLHLIVRDLAGALPAGRDNQIHAIGVRTDRATAFSEGFAEHAQVMAVDAPDASPDTTRLLAERYRRAWANEELEAYRHALSARWSLASKARMTFPLWFSPNEQVLRYYAVRENLFARDAPIPSRAKADPYRAYLLENTSPGSADGAPKSAGRLMATEGVVSALFYRLATSATLQRQYRDDRFYAAFGVTARDIDSLDNVYLKLFAAIKEGQAYDAVAVIDAYVRLFPEDGGAVADVVHATLLGQELPRARPIWLLNDRVQTGTSLFDQYRGQPRAHTFDLNAASLADVSAVPGVTPALATAILSNAPYESVGDLQRVPSAGAAVGHIARMEAAYRAHVSAPDEGPGLTMKAVLYPYLWRALVIGIACAILGGAIYRAVRRVRWYRVVLNGLAVALVGLGAGWSVDLGTGLLALAAPIVVCGLPASLIALSRTRSLQSAGVVLTAWSLASIVPVLVVRPIG